MGTYGRIWYGRRGNGSWARAKFRDVDGVTRVIERWGQTRAAAERELRQALRDRSGPAGAGDLTGGSRLAAAIDRWLVEVDEAGHAPGTAQLYRRTADGRIRRGLGELRVRECDPAACDRFIRKIRTEHGPGAARTAKNVLSLVMQLCVRFGAIDANPIANVGKVRQDRKDRPRALTLAEEVDLQKRVDAEAYSGAGRRPGDELDLPDIVRSLRGTGCRIGEVLAVRRDVVDLDAGVVEVNATVVRITGRGSVLQERAKSDAGWRVIAVPGWLVEVWRERMDLVHPLGQTLVWVVSADGRWRQVPAHELGLLWPSIEGHIRHPGNVQRGLRAVLDRAAPGEYDWVVPHTFRRTVATRLDQAGASARQIADHLGHERPSMTQDVYMGRGVAFAGAATMLSE